MSTSACGGRIWDVFGLAVVGLCAAIVVLWQSYVGCECIASRRVAAHRHCGVAPAPFSTSSSSILRTAWDRFPHVRCPLFTHGLGSFPTCPSSSIRLGSFPSRLGIVSHIFVVLYLLGIVFPTSVLLSSRTRLKAWHWSVLAWARLLWAGVWTTVRDAQAFERLPVWVALCSGARAGSHVAARGVATRLTRVRHLSTPC